MDNEWRDAERSRDIALWSKVIPRMPKEAVDAAIGRLTREIEILTSMVKKAEKLRPRCGCGEPLPCAKCVLALEVMASKTAAPHLRMVAFAQLGCPGVKEGYCHAPGCEVYAGMDYDSYCTWCDAHNAEFNHHNIVFKWRKS